jgi:hypothetical protein
MLTDTREELARVEDQIRGLREERARAQKVRQAATAAYEASQEDEAAFKAAKAAVDAVKAIDSRLEEVGEQQTGLLRKLGDSEVGIAGFASPNVNGWHEASHKLSLADGRLRVDVNAQTLLQPGRAPALPRVPTQPTIPSPVSSRWLYPIFEARPFGSRPGDVATTDFSLTEDPVSGVVDGVEIPVASDEQKAVMTPTGALVTPTARTFAVVLGPVPAKVVDTQPALQQLLSVEMARQLDAAYDAHVVAKIEAANPPSGSTGTTLLERIRRAIADMRDLGGVPQYLAVTPQDAAGLDLSVHPGSGDYVFRVDLEGSGGVVWSLRVREVPSISAPTLIDPVRLGLSFVGEGSVLVDPFGSNLETNQVKIRTEAEAVFSVRARSGAYVIE